MAYTPPISARPSKEPTAMLVRDLNRRSFLQGLAGGRPGGVHDAGRCSRNSSSETGTTTEGPFYPDKLPLDTDNDLLIINDAITPARRRDHAPDRPRADASRATGPQRVRRDLAGRSHGFVRPHRRPAADRLRQELPGLRPLPDRLEGPVLLPHDQADRLHADRHLPHRAHSRGGQPERPARVHVADAWSTGIRPTRATASCAASTRARSRRCSSTSSRCPARSSAS